MKQTTQSLARIFATLFFFLTVQPRPLQAACIGDCDSDGDVEIDELAAIVSIILGGAGSCPGFSGGVEAVIHAVRDAQGGTCSNTPSPSGNLAVVVDKDFAGSATVTVSGYNKRGLVFGAGPPCSYSNTFTLTSTDPQTLTFTGLAIGEWVHTVKVATLSGNSVGQIQHRSGLIIDLGAGFNGGATWEVFPSVRQVNTPTDGTTCTASSCSLRGAVTQANTLTGPTLIQFDHSTLWEATPIELTTNTEIRLQKNITIDGIDDRGNPSSLDAFTDRKYPIQVLINPTTKNGSEANSGRFFISGASSSNMASGELVGLSITRVLGTDTEVNGKNQDLVRFGPNVLQGKVEISRLDGGAQNGTSAGNGVLNDCVEALSSGASSPIVSVGHSELRHCYGWGAKAFNGHMSVSESWIHNNLNGGVLAQRGVGSTLGGTIDTSGNIIELNGRNGTNAITRQGAAQVNCDCEAQSGCSGSTAPCTINVRGDIIRGGNLASTSVKTNQGILFGKNSKGTVNDAFICGNAQHGIQGVSSAGDEGQIQVLGTSSVLNNRGAAMDVDPDTDDVANFAFSLGEDEDVTPGRNAFTQNMVTNFRREDGGNRPDTEAKGNQWQRCGIGANCLNGQIETSDIFLFQNVSYRDAQPHRNPGGDPFIETLSPTRVAKIGELVEIHGLNFDAIDGYDGAFQFDPGGGATRCDDLHVGNTCQCNAGGCSSNRGTCVVFVVDGQSFPAKVIAVTPTTIVVESPIECAKAASITVHRRNHSNGDAFNLPAKAFCN